MIKRKPNKAGGGSKTNINGLSFEERTDLLEAFNKTSFLEVNGNQVLKDSKLIGEYFEKNGFYKFFLEKNDINYKEINSKKYLPDAVFYNHNNDTVYIIEKKFQEGTGSVDEKLQTCDFKRKIYKRLISPIGLNTEYYYLLNDWFKKPVYDDVFSYIVNSNCKYFIDFIPFEELGL